jgi:hypothetical protein
MCGFENWSEAREIGAKLGGFENLKMCGFENWS